MVDGSDHISAVSDGIAGGDPLLRWVLGRTGITPLRVALATLLLGFGTLGAWYLIVVARGDVGELVRGVLAYLTGSLGDALLLPPAAALSLAALRSLDAMVDIAGGSTDGAIRTAVGKLSDTLHGGAATRGPLALAVGIVGWYHLPWVTDATFWSETIAPQPIVILPAVWHAGFMVLAIWWLVAFAARLVLAGAMLLPVATRAGGISREFVHVTYRAWRSSLGLCAVLAVFASLLWFERVGPVLPWDAAFVEPPVGLSAALVVPVLLGVILYERFWIAPVRTAVRNSFDGSGER